MPYQGKKGIWDNFSLQADLFIYSKLISRWIKDIKQSYLDDPWITQQ
jgi:hypothetical protein